MGIINTHPIAPKMIKTNPEKMLLNLSYLKMNNKPFISIKK